MAEHYQRWVTEVTHWCNRCGEFTRHHVSDGRLAHCLEHEAPQYTKAQLARREKQEKRRQTLELFNEEKK